MTKEFTNKLFDLKEFTQYSSTFIETGTSMGDGVQRAVDAGFEYVCSMEADEKLFRDSTSRFQNNFNIDVMFGESIKILPFLLKNIAAKPTVFFLDAHPAGEGTYNHEQWEATKENFQHETILAELEIILSNSNRHIIIIDDVPPMNPEGVELHTRQYITKMWRSNNNYQFKFYDENLTGNNLFKNKILAAVL